MTTSTPLQPSYFTLTCWILTWCYSQSVQVKKFSVEGTSNIYVRLSFSRQMSNWVIRWRTRASRVACRRQDDGMATERAMTPSLATRDLLTSPIWPSRASCSSDRWWTTVRIKTASCNALRHKLTSVCMCVKISEIQFQAVHQTGTW